MCYVTSSLPGFALTAALTVTKSQSKKYITNIQNDGVEVLSEVKIKTTQKREQFSDNENTLFDKVFFALQKGEFKLVDRVTFKTPSRDLQMASCFKFREINTFVIQTQILDSAQNT